jgi:DsbC/DsbD-like thiol-disulfide interchange protein
MTVRNALTAAATALFLSTTLTAQPGRPRAEVTPLAESDGVHAGAAVRLALRVSLPDGIHVQSNQPRDPMLIASALTIEPPAGVTLSEIIYPAATDFAQSGQATPLSVFEQQFVLGAKLRVDAGAAAGPLVIPGRLRYQACDASTCFAPAREEVKWTLAVVPASTPTPAKFPDVFRALAFTR